MSDFKKSLAIVSNSPWLSSIEKGLIIEELRTIMLTRKIVCTPAKN
jgi:hypothetical protein